MTEASAARRRDMWVAAALGTYAAAIAIAPARVALGLAAPLAALPLACWTLARPARWVMAFLCACLLLPPLPLPLGNSGPHPALLFAALGLFAGILFLPAWRIDASLLTWAQAGLCFALAASLGPALVYSGPEIAAASMARVALFGLSVYVFFYEAYGPGALERGGELRRARILYGAAVASALFACVDFYFQLPAPAGYGPQFVWLDSGIYRRAQGVFYEASTLGNFCAFFLAMIMTALARPRGQAPFSRPALLAGGTVFFTALLFSYSRASLVNVAVALVTLVFLNRARMALRWLAAGAAAAVLAGYALLPGLADAWWLRLKASAEYLLVSPEGVLSGRLASWRALADLAWEHPWRVAAGIGYKTLPYTSAFGRPVVADNMYLSMLIETGVAGLAALLLFHFAVLRAAWQARASFFGAWFFCFWMGQLAQMLSGDLLTYWRVLPLYLWVLAMAVRETRDAHPLS